MKYLKNNLAYLGVWFLALVPVFIWLFLKPIPTRFASPGLIFRSLGQLTALVGTALLSLNFVLSTRFKFLDKIFFGLNRVYIHHHQIGLIAFCLLLFHPMFLITRYLAISLGAAFNFILPFNDPGVILGEMGLLVFILLIVLTIYTKLKHQVWKGTHKFLGLVLIFGVIHMLAVPSDISSNALLKYYMLLLAVVGFFAFIYRVVFLVYRFGEYHYKLKSVKDLKNNIIELQLVPLDQKMDFLPGQFVFVRFKESGFTESHPFSVASSLPDGGLNLNIKALGDYTAHLKNLKPGTTCLIEGPFGDFSYIKVQSRRQIWVAGGIGITPFIAMAKHLSENGEFDYAVDLYYSIKNQNEATFANELSAIARNRSNFRFFKHFSDQNGHISAHTIISKNENIHGIEVFLCGPPLFMKSLREQFLKLGLSNYQIHSEEFNFN